MTDRRSKTLRRLDNERQKAKNEAERAAIRERFADYDPPNVRTYGEPYDSIIHAAALSSVPYPESPNRGTRR